MSRRKTPNTDWANSSKDPLLTTEQAAQFLSVAPDTLKFWRMKRWMSGPRFVRFGKGIVRYLNSDLRDYVNANRVQIIRGNGNVERNASLKLQREAKPSSGTGRG